MSKAGEGKFEQQEDKNVKKDDLNGLGGDLLSKKDPVKATEKNAETGASKLENIDPLEKAQVGDKNSPEKVVTDLQKNIAPKVESLVAAGELKKDTVDQWKNQFKYIPDSVWKSMEKAN